MGATMPDQPRLIAGVGDEIIYGSLTLLSIIIPTVLSIRNLFRQRNQPGIHPDFAATVQSTRQHLHPQGDGNGTQNQSQPEARLYNRGQVSCPICLNEAAYVVETNCGHLYCGQCLLAYWQHRNWFGAIPCPSCRARVTMLLLHFTAVEDTEGTGTATQVRQGVSAYNRRFSGEHRTVMEVISDMPALLRHAWTDYRFTFHSVFFVYQLQLILLITLGLVYLLSPVDVIPEAAFGIFGFFDDLVVIFIIVVCISMLYRRFVVNRGLRMENSKGMSGFFNKASSNLP